MAYIKLKHESITHDLDDNDFITVLGSSVTYSGKKNIGAEPNVNGNDIVEVQTQSFDNPRIVIANVKLHDTTYFNMSDLLELYKAKYDGLNPITLVVAYSSDDMILPSLTSSTSMLVVLDSWSVVLDARATDNAYMPALNLNFIETK